MMPTSQEELLGSLIPNVFIDGVTLESSGKPPEVNNPHIDHERETVVSSDLNFDEGALKVTIDSSIKEIIGDDRSRMASSFSWKFVMRRYLPCII